MIYNISKATAMLAMVYSSSSARASSILHQQESRGRVRGASRRRGLKGSKATPSPTSYSTMYPSAAPTKLPSASPTETTDITLQVSFLKGFPKNHSMSELPETDENGCFETDGLTYNMEMMVKPMVEQGEFCHTYLNQNGEDRYLKCAILACQQQDRLDDDGSSCYLPSESLPALPYYVDGGYSAVMAQAESNVAPQAELNVAPKLEWIRLYYMEYQCSNPDCTSCLEEGVEKIILYKEGFGENPENKCWFEENYHPPTHSCFTHYSKPMLFLESNNNSAMVDQYYKTLAEHSCVGEYLKN